MNRPTRRRLRIPSPHRRGFLTAAAGLFGAASLGGCDRLAGTEWGRRTLKVGEDANMFVQRLALTPASLAREFPESEISTWFKPNGTVDPEDKPYKALAAKNFETYRLRIDGLVEQPQDFSLTDLRAMSARTQITRHDCVEGWSAIGKWTGVPLSEVLQKARLKREARFIVFHCADTMEFTDGSDADDTQASDDTAPSSDKTAENGGQSSSGTLAWGGGGAENRASDSQSADIDAPQGRTPIRYYESIDLVDAYHPQTILAYDLNGKPLPVSNGAPLRLRVERQLGYKQAKYIMRIEVADGLTRFGDGQGGYWEDRGYDWYAGI